MNSIQHVYYKANFESFEHFCKKVCEWDLFKQIYSPKLSFFETIEQVKILAVKNLYKDMYIINTCSFV